MRPIDSLGPRDGSSRLCKCPRDYTPLVLLSQASGGAKLGAAMQQVVLLSAPPSELIQVLARCLPDPRQRRMPSSCRIRYSRHPPLATSLMDLNERYVRSHRALPPPSLGGFSLDVGPDPFPVSRVPSSRPGRYKSEERRTLAGL